MSRSKPASRSLLLATLVALSVPQASCGGTAPAADAVAVAGGQAAQSSGSTGIRSLAEGAYFGVVKVRVVPPDGSGVRPASRNGTGSAELAEAGRLVVVGDIDGEADAGFAADGRFQGGGWSGGTGDVQLAIGSDGVINGGGIADGNRMSIQGRIDRRRLDLFFEVELLSASAGGFPAGTRFQFRYDLWRPFERAPGREGRTSAGGCREVVYRNKLVPNLSGGAMGMVRVPECRR